MSSPDPIDWTGLALELGSIGPDALDPASARFEHGGSHLARRALAALLGEAEVERAVEHCLASRPGFELARSVLSLLRPRAAMLACRRASLPGEPLERRRAAVELLRVVAEREALEWVGEYLEDADEEVQLWGMGVLDHLVLRGLLDDADPVAVEALLARGEAHANEGVREIARRVWEQWRADRAPSL